MGYFDDYPFHVFLILANELCERFSFYGMKAVLVIFLWKGLGKSKDVATTLFHTFVLLCYLTPLLGAMVADGWLGKYKTILYVSMVYATGSILMTVSAIPTITGNYIGWLSFVGLVIIAFGTGGIKPCVSSFGGDQFKENQVRQKDSFFSLFYLTINIGSMISTLLIPFIRGNVTCFGKECYALCFGIPAVLMIISIVLFAIGTKWYVKNPPGDSILQKFFGCIKTALGKKCSCSKSSDYEKKDHWIDHAAPKYSQAFIEDVKDVLRVAWLFIPVPVFWALFDQLGSKWTFQAQQLNGDFEGITVFPDMMSFMNPLLVVVVVPFLEYAVYPILDKLHIPNRPLQRMTLGMFLAGTAFLMTSFLQIAIDTDRPRVLDENEAKFQIINGYHGRVNVTCTYSHGSLNSSIEELEALYGGDYKYIAAGAFEIKVQFEDGQNVMKIITFENKAYQVFITASRHIVWYTQSLTVQTDKGESMARLFNGMPYKVQVRLFTQKGNEPFDYDFEAEKENISSAQRLIFADFNVKYKNSTGEFESLENMIESKNGAVNLLLLAKNKNGKTELRQINEVKPWSKNIFLQTPQFVVMSFGECLFSVTGLSFAYTQAPPSMKSILTAIWLLTVCFGNIIIILVESFAGGMSELTEFFLYTGLMYVTTVIFAIMSCMYKYVTPRQIEDLEVKQEGKGQQGYDNQAVILDDVELFKRNVSNDLTSF